LLLRIALAPNVLTASYGYYDRGNLHMHSSSV